MKIAAAQIESLKGKVEANIAKHISLIEKAIQEQVGAIFFPELSITGYEPEHAAQWAMAANNIAFQCFQKISNQHNILIGLGCPSPSAAGTLISMFIFQSNLPVQVYSKQQLHPDEFPYFVPGNQPCILQMGNTKIAPAICFESLQEHHATTVYQLGATCYLASVAKSAVGIEKASVHYSSIAKKFGIPVMMANGIGPAENFIAAGSSAAWNQSGTLLKQLKKDREGILLFDTATNTAEMLQA